MTVELLSVVVPVYNEAQTVRAVIERLLTVPLPIARQIVVVDDGSSDGTYAELAELKRSSPEITLVRGDRNRGKGSAVRLGLSHARGSIVAIQDADLELDPAELGTLVAPILRDETQVVYGSRFLAGRPQAPWLTIAANRLLTAVCNTLYRSGLTDMETCYKLMRIDVARSLELESDRFDIEPEITVKLLRRGHRIVELPVTFRARSRSQGKKINWRDGVHAVAVLVRYRLMRDPSASRWCP